MIQESHNSLVHSRRMPRLVFIVRHSAIIIFTVSSPTSVYKHVSILTHLLPIFFCALIKMSHHIFITCFTIQIQ